MRDVLTIVFTLAAVALVGCGDDAETMQTSATTGPGAGGEGGHVGQGGQGGEGGGQGGGGHPACDVGTASELVVPTESGPVRGKVEEGVSAYLGVPYAAPPVGDSRFRAPAPAACFDAVPRDATVEGPNCMSFGVSGGQLDFGKVAGQEDCLTLNVWTPATAPDEALPVMVFTHGGGYVSRIGEAYDGAKLANDANIVVVTYNYRVGQLGYLAHAGLLAETPSDGTGNYGVLDTIAALGWVHRNIATFGGDPSRVLLSGQSAGGGQVAATLASPLASGLYARALVESGFYSARPLDAAEAQGNRIAKGVGCEGAVDVPACLRAVPAEDLFLKYPHAGIVLGYDSYGPVVDGVVVPVQPHEHLAAGDAAAVPVIFGANRDESTPFVATQPQLESWANANLGSDADAVLALYPADQYPTPGAAFAALATDYQFVCPTRRAARASAAAGRPTYAYYLTYTLENAPPSLAYSFHKLELLLLFRASKFGFALTPGDLAFGDLVTGYFTAFAADGAPHAPAAADWNAFTPAGGYLELAAPEQLVAGDLRAAVCDLIEPHLP